jgi:hypothetical protein
MAASNMAESEPRDKSLRVVALLVSPVPWVIWFPA